MLLLWKKGHHIKDCPEKKAGSELKSEMEKLAKGEDDARYDELGF